jgi:hypothetical protein
MEETYVSETLLDFLVTTRRYIPEDRNAVRISPPKSEECFKVFVHENVMNQHIPFKVELLLSVRLVETQVCLYVLAIPLMCADIQILKHDPGVLLLQNGRCAIHERTLASRLLQHTDNAAGGSR